VAIRSLGEDKIFDPLSDRLTQRARETLKQLNKQLGD
jgi:hypothetical protein